MKKLLFGIIVLSASLAHAERRFMIQASTNSAPLPQPKEWVSEAFFYSSATCSGTTAANIGISTSPAQLYAVQITSAGVGLPIVTIFDSPAVSLDGATTARKISAPIDASKTGQYTFNVYASSGIWLNSSGVIPPCLNVIYSER